MEEFLQFAASLFGVSREEISLETQYGSLPQWDSMMQIRMIAEIEDVYGVIIPMEDVADIRTLADFYKYLG